MRINNCETSARCYSTCCRWKLCRIQILVIKRIVCVTVCAEWEILQISRRSDQGTKCIHTTRAWRICQIHKWYTPGEDTRSTANNHAFVSIHVPTEANTRRNVPGRLRPLTIVVMSKTSVLII